ncbi:uncharacterized protein [Amphiura filiformis]|uniref:uncharacterized protein n=1 Tax=Amphiura filiformis TaxID=82378 RepID=UPI003B226427
MQYHSPYDNVIGVISAESTRRNKEDVDKLLPWFQRQSDLFKRLSADSLREIITNCEFRRYNENDVIIKQGEKGHSFFIILSGSTSIYISSDDDDQDWESPRHPDDKDDEDDGGDDKDDAIKDSRIQYGIHIGTLGPGSSFGELALIDEACLRTASIIANQLSDMIVIHRNLYNRMLKEAQKKDIEEKIDFINKHPLFRKWKQRHRSALALGLRKTTMDIGNYLTRDRAMYRGIFLIKSGHFVESIEVATKESDYHLPCLTKQCDANKDDASEKCLHCEGETKRTHLGMKQLDIGLLAGNDIIGDLEMLCNLRVNIHSALCIEPAEVFAVNKKTFHKFLNKRYPDTYEVIQRSALMILRHRLYRIGPAKLYQYPALLQKIQSLSQHEKDDDIVPDLNMWMHRGPLIDDRGPGSLYYRIQRKYQQILRMKAIRQLGKIKEDNNGNEYKITNEKESQERTVGVKLKDSVYGVVKSQSLVQMFQKALTIRAEINQSDGNTTMGSSLTEDDNEIDNSTNAKIRKRLESVETNGPLEVVKETGKVSLPNSRNTLSMSARTSRLTRVPNTGKTRIKFRQDSRRIRSAPSSSSIVYRQFNQEQKKKCQRTYTAEQYKDLKDVLRLKEKQHSVHNLWL